MQLVTEEQKARDELDKKLSAEHQLIDQGVIAKQEEEERQYNRDMLVNQQLKLSVLQADDERLSKELAEDKQKNKTLQSENAELEKFIDAQNKEIEQVIQRI